MDSLRSIIDDHGGAWQDKRVSISILGEVTIMCHVDEDGCESAVESERSTVMVDRAAETKKASYDTSIVSLPAKAVTEILKILFDSYRSIRVEKATEEDHEEAAQEESE